MLFGLTNLHKQKLLLIICTVSEVFLGQITKSIKTIKTENSAQSIYKSIDQIHVLMEKKIRINKTFSVHFKN